MFFCRNCGEELTGTPEICTNCGVKPIAGTSFCPWCGAPTTPLDEICTNCGVELAKAVEEKTWKPTAAGILSIICGVGQVIGGMLFAVGSSFLARFTEMEFIGGVIERFSASYTLIGILLIVLGVIAIVGGICALRRRIWGLALAGSICALPAGLILGMLAIIFVISGKREFGCGARMTKEPAEAISPKTEEPAEAISPKTEEPAEAISPKTGEPAEAISPKSRLATTLFAFSLVGVFGAHRFYIGKTRTAIVMLLLGIAGLATLVLAIAWPLDAKWFFVGIAFIIAVGIWAFVDFIFAVTGRMKDDEGRLIQQWELVVPARAISPKSRLTTTLLVVFLGFFGVHRFYLGKIGTAFAMLFTSGGGGIWALIDFIFAVSGSMKDNEGRLIKKWRPVVVPAEYISPKLRLATALLALFLGVFGAHRFYVGKKETASVMLFFSILGLTILGLEAMAQLSGAWFFWGISFIIAVGIWAFVDFIFAVMGRMEDDEGRLIQRWWPVVAPARAPAYYYIKYTTSALRVVAWMVLALGFIGSLVWGISTGGIEGGVLIVIGMVGSFLAWLLLLAARELIKLFMDVKENTINSAESVIKKSH